MKKALSQPSPVRGNGIFMAFLLGSTSPRHAAAAPSYPPAPDEAREPPAP